MRVIKCKCGNKASSNERESFDEIAITNNWAIQSGQYICDDCQKPKKKKSTTMKTDYFKRGQHEPETTKKFQD